MTLPPRSSRWSSTQAQGISASLLSAVVLGLTAVFGKQAINAGTPPFTVVMLRTVIATALLWSAYLLFRPLRQFMYIYLVGILGCLSAGLINGLGSLMYYAGLSHMNASLAQMLYTIYPLLLTLLSRLDGYPISRFTALRLGLALGAVYLLVGVDSGHADWVGVLLMLGSGALYALHLAVNQRVLYDVPAPTVTLYTLTAMSLTVTAAYFISGQPIMPPSLVAWQSVGLLTLVTLISRLALFAGVKRLGGVQTALLGLSELLVTVFTASILLNEKLTPIQWLGAGLLTASVLLVIREKSLGTIPEPKPWFQVLTTPVPPTFPPPTPSTATNPQKLSE
jgi:drug/metabolite transporter (DMT)-like permease